ncbi:uncharacterized protein LOC111878643 isoform X2 [Lactuca sativa]|uniref:uncharacterized protein LOC111878643 isoform X2 n=1 Tax=Lactuca sativa TaxID=4236 RepID=UPI001C690CBF|nr:uncharacterized protein LOC111878643 isoform X2 [Lactuca sativa]
MSTKSSIASVMAWNWVVQSLAMFKQVDPSILIGVVKKALAISDDLGKDSREVVSLRMLESMFTHGNEATIDTHSTQNAKISFDPSEQCEDVLHRILEETSEPMTESERQKWNVHPFVIHKRASLPKSPLEKVGNSFFFYAFCHKLSKKFILCIIKQLKEEILEGSHPLLASLKKRSYLENINIPENSLNTFPEVNVHFNDQTTVSKDDLASMNLRNENNKLPKSPLQNPDDVDNATRGNTEHIQRKENEIPKEPPAKGLEENTLMDHNDQTPSKNLEQNCDDLNADHGQQELTDEKCDDEMTNIAAMKEAFLNSQHTLSQDSMATIDSTEICLCMKCNNGGELLVCSSDTCQLRVHESCLGSTTTTLDKNGKFLCPFCAYSHAISMYLEAKKKTSLARKDLQAFMSSAVKHRPNKSTQTEALGQKVKGNVNGHTVRRDTEDRTPNEHKQKCNENESHVSKTHSRRCRDQKPQYTSPTIPLIRRNKLQWTMSEEGVQRFSSNNNSKGFPWKDILDFGGDVFHKSRTTIDLKDKWRNLCKGSPAKKKQRL